MFRTSLIALDIRGFNVPFSFRKVLILEIVNSVRGNHFGLILGALDVLQFALNFYK